MAILLRPSGIVVTAMDLPLTQHVAAMFLRASQQHCGNRKILLRPFQEHRCDRGVQIAAVIAACPDHCSDIVASNVAVTIAAIFVAIVAAIVAGSNFGIVTATLLSSQENCSHAIATCFLRYHRMRIVLEQKRKVGNRWIRESVIRYLQASQDFKDSAAAVF